MDAIVYPTIAFDGEDRYAFVEVLAKRGLIEWCTLDTGSVNLASTSDIAAGTEGSVYINAERTIRRGMTIAAEFGIHPTFACYEPGFIRLGAALMRQAGNVPAAIYRLMFSDGMAFGFPPEPYALEAYRLLLASEAPDAPVMIAGLDACLGRVAADAISSGLHLRVGLEDAPLGCALTNLALVEEAVARYDARRPVATVQEVRQALAVAES